MYIEKIRATNFLSFKELEYSFNRGVPTLIVGKNLTDDGQKSNGSGKSALQSVVEYVIEKSTSRKGRDVELVMWDEKQATAEVTIICPVRKEKIRILRTIPIKGSTTAVVYKNDNEEPVSLANVSDVDNFIINWVGISKEDLQNYFIINKERYTSFFTSSNTKKIELVNRFSDASIVDSAFDEIDTELEGKEAKLLTYNSENLTLTSSIETLEEELEEEQQRNIDKEIEDKIIEIEEENVRGHDVIRAYENKIKGFKQQRKDINKKINKVSEFVGRVKTWVENFDAVDYSKQIAKKQKEIYGFEENEEDAIELKTEFKNTLDAQNREISELELDLMGTVHCPACHHEFNPSKQDVDVKQVESMLSTKRKTVEHVSREIEDIQVIVDSIQDTIADKQKDIKNIRNKEKELNKQLSIFQKRLKSLNKLFNTLSNEEITLSDSIEAHEKSIERCNNDIGANIKRIEELKAKDRKNPKLIDLEAKIKLKNDSKQVIEDKIKLIEDELTEIRKWGTRFTQFKSHIANQSLLIIQSRVNDQLSKMKSNLRLKLEGFKVLANGKLKEEITPYILKEGRLVGYGALSGGEKARLEVANILAVQDIINSEHDHGGLDFIWIDEVLESADEMGIALLMESLGGIEKTINITTHVSIESVMCEILTIEKTNGISNIVKN